MISLRISSVRLLQNETLKIFSQKFTQVAHRHSILLRNVSGNGTSKISQKFDFVNARNFKYLSANNRLYSVSAPVPKEAENYRNDNQITVVGEDVPDPIQNIDESDFPDYIMKYLKREGIEKPTIIQAQGWPIATAGKNLVGIAQTGTGKTLAYLLPAIVHVKEKVTRKGTGPSVLVLAPTRELARQIQQVAEGVTRSLGIRTACVYGGASRVKQENDLQRGVDILIATPGRLLDFLTSQTTSLDRCSYFVLDEADRMLDMGFEPQIRQVADMIKSERQILMWSATWPKEVKELARDYLGEYTQVNVGSVELSANHNIKQVIYVCEEEEKRDKLNEILQEIMDSDSGKILIFANMKRTVENVTHRLRTSGFPAAGIHGDKSQMQRDSIIYQFKRGKTKILVASDVAARGLDVDNVTHVINYDYPNNSEDYIHRIGRTARSEATGTSHSLLTPDNAKQAKDLIPIMREAGQEIPQELQELAALRTGNDKPKYKSRYGGGGGGGGFNKFSPRNKFGSNNWRSSGRPRRDDFSDFRRNDDYSDYKRSDDYSDNRRNKDRYDY